MADDSNVFKRVHSTCLGFNTRKAARVITDNYDAILEPSGVRAAQFSLLVAIREFEPVPIHALAAGLGMDRTTLTRTLKPLQDSGWIEVTPAQDQRVREVTLTNDGEAAFEQALPLWEKAQAQMSKLLGEQEAGRFLSSLHTIGHTSKTEH